MSLYCSKNDTNYLFFKKDYCEVYLEDFKMIAYKLVIEKDNKFYPLVNFGINCWMGDTNFPPYELNKTYEYGGEGKEFFERKCKTARTRNYAEMDGYHFWLESNKEDLINQWNEYFRKKGKRERINAILKCEVHKIRWVGLQYYNKEHKKIIASEFTPLEVIKI